jgi:hypothetical protein
MIAPRSLFVLLTLMLAPLVAHAADDPPGQVVVTGEAPSTSANARVQALVQAFAQAIKQSISDLVDGSVIRDNRERLRTEIIGHARRFIISYQVIEERTQGGRVSLKLAVTVDRKKLRESLGALGIQADAAAARNALRPKAVILSRETGPRGLVSNLGTTPRSGPCELAFRAVLDSLGFAVVETPAVVPVTIEASADLPVEPASAVAIAKSAQDGAVFIVGATALGAGPIRGTTQSGAEAQAVARVIDTNSEAEVADASVTGSGFGAGVTEAAARAASDVCEKAARHMAPKISARWPLAPRDSANLRILIAGARSWAPASAIVRELGDAAAGMQVKAVGGGRVTLGLSTKLTPEQVSLILMRVKLQAAQLSVRVDGDRVLVAVQGDQRIQPGDLPTQEDVPVMVGE